MPGISEVRRPGPVVRACYRIDARMFGAVPTLAAIMAHRFLLMLGIGGLYGAIEWFGRVEAQLRALLQIHVARLRDSAY